MNEEKTKEYYDMLDRNGGCWSSMMGMAAVLLFVVLLLVSCRTIEYVDRPVVHTEYVYRDRTDSIRVSDSIYIKEVVKGDSVKVVEYRWRDRFQYISTVDTLVVRDTVQVVSVQVVEKTVDRMNSLQAAFFWLGLLTMLAGLCYVVWRIIKRKFLHL